VGGAVEELLRHQTPVMMCPASLRRDYEMGGVQFQAGDGATLLIGAANCDTGPIFEDPSDVRFDRESNRHLAFGGGAHRCLGSHLARLELTVALEEFPPPDTRIRADASDGHLVLARHPSDREPVSAVPDPIVKAAVLRGAGSAFAVEE